MTLSNYQDVSRTGANVDAGFQFEFHCDNCSRRWKSPYKPYRRGQLSALIYRFAYYLDNHGRMSRMSNALSDAGMKGARAAALQQAIDLAEQRYTECPSCRKTVCEDCWNPRTQRCEGCERKGGGEPASGVGGSTAGSYGGGNGASAGLACPNCRAPFGGGRFCAECGFDMASTHKSCPGCGAMSARAAHFCPDCGHGF